MLAAACGSSDTSGDGGVDDSITDSGDGDPTGNDEQGDGTQEPEDVATDGELTIDGLAVTCGPRPGADEEYQHRELPPVVPDLLLVPPGTRDEDFLDLADADVSFSILEIVDLENVDAVADFFTRRYSVGDGVDLLGSYANGSVWQELAASFDVVWFPERVWSNDDGSDTSGIDTAIAELASSGTSALPVHTVGYANHFGAFPGMKPHICTDEGEPFGVAESTGDGPVVGIVDSGYWTVDKPNGEMEPSQCVVSHGEFVADVIRQVDPSAEIYGTSAFNLKDAGGSSLCSVTDTIGVFRAVSELLQVAAESDIEFDRLNLSIGASSHGDFDPAVVTFDETGGRTLVEILGDQTTASVYAAAGNVGSDEPVYPASHADVIGVGTRSGTTPAKSFVWTETEDSVEYDLPSANLRAPGCDLAGAATSDAGAERVLWGGSSFATAVATGLGATTQSEIESEVDGLPASLAGLEAPGTGRCQ